VTGWAEIPGSSSAFTGISTPAIFSTSPMAPGLLRSLLGIDSGAIGSDCENLVKSANEILQLVAELDRVKKQMSEVWRQGDSRDKGMEQMVKGIDAFEKIIAPAIASALAVGKVAQLLQGSVNGYTSTMGGAEPGVFSAISNPYTRPEGVVASQMTTGATGGFLGVIGQILTAAGQPLLGKLFTQLGEVEQTAQQIFGGSSSTPAAAAAPAAPTSATTPAIAGAPATASPSTGSIASAPTYGSSPYGYPPSGYSPTTGQPAVASWIPNDPSSGSGGGGGSTGGDGGGSGSGHNQHGSHGNNHHGGHHNGGHNSGHQGGHHGSGGHNEDTTVVLSNGDGDSVTLTVDGSEDSTVTAHLGKGDNKVTVTVTPND
jgi:hypothetical protein